MLSKLLQENILILPPIKENPRTSMRPWYKENNFFKYHRQSGYNTNGWMWLKHEIQDLIDNGQVSIGSLISPPNQHLGIFNDPLPSHDQSETSISYEKDYHEVGPPCSYGTFVGWPIEHGPYPWLLLIIIFL